MSKPGQRIPRQQESVSNLPQVDQLAPHLPKLAKDQPMNIFSASTTLAVPLTTFDKYPEVFPAEKNMELPPLRPEMNHTINLKDSSLVV